MKTKFFDIAFKAADVADSGVFKGYGSKFGELDQGGDIVMPGAFNESLALYAAKERKVPILLQHNTKQPIGVYPVIKEDDIGLWVEGELNMDVQAGRETHSLMKQGALTGLSIGYSIIKDTTDSKTGIRQLHKLELWEISPVTFPMLDSARATDVKSLQSIRECEDFLRDVGGMSQSEAKAFIAVVKKANDAQRDVAGDDAMLDGFIDQMKRLRA